jgi:ribosome-binding protein aMBF1 (putative translation factor)
MEAATLIREARRRAGLTQSQLAALADTKQSVVARWESGATEPSYERVATLIRRSGFDLIPEVISADDSDWSLARDNLSLSVDQRLAKHAAAVRFAQAGRKAKSRAERA